MLIKLVYKLRFQDDFSLCVGEKNLQNWVNLKLC